MAILHLKFFNTKTYVVFPHQCRKMARLVIYALLSCLFQKFPVKIKPINNAVISQSYTLYPKGQNNSFNDIYKHGRYQIIRKTKQYQKSKFAH